MKKLKCESCGSSLKVDEKEQFAYCEYCGTKYKLNEDVNFNVNLNLDDNMKESLEKGGKLATKIGFGTLAVIIIAFIAFIVIAVMVINSFMNFNETDNNTFDEFEINSFNSHYELYKGTQHKMFVNELLDEVITNNKKNKDKQITIIYGEQKTNDPDKVLEIKQSLKNNMYEVILDYNDNGCVNKITLKDLDY